MNKYLVVPLDERQNNIIKLKAAIDGKSIENFVLSVLDDARINFESKVCCYCEKNMKTKIKSKEYHFGDTAYEVINYPILHCNHCDADYDDLNISLYTKELAEMEVRKSLKDRKGIPNEIDFNSLVIGIFKNNIG